MVPELLRKRGKPSRGPIVTTFHRNKKNYIIGTIICDINYCNCLRTNTTASSSPIDITFTHRRDLAYYRAITILHTDD